MSRTDKDDPYWVKELHYGRPIHNHDNGVCDYSPRNHGGWRLGIARCGNHYDMPHYMYWIHPGKVRHISIEMNRIDRRDARQALRQGKYEHEALDRKTRNRALWEAW